jgi:hypothetical protein
MSKLSTEFLIETALKQLNNLILLMAIREHHTAHATTQRMPSRSTCH